MKNIIISKLINHKFENFIKNIGNTIKQKQYKKKKIIKNLKKMYQSLLCKYILIFLYHQYE